MRKFSGCVVSCVIASAESTLDVRKTARVCTRLITVQPHFPWCLAPQWERELDVGERPDAGHGILMEVLDKVESLTI